jgi:hypothetical protein
MSFSRATDALLKAVNSVFGTSVTYTYLDDEIEPSQIKGVFDNAFVQVGDVATRKPILKIRLGDLETDPVEGDTIEINSNTYIVKDQEPDGLGSCTLILEKTT